MFGAVRILLSLSLLAAIAVVPQVNASEMMLVDVLKPLDAEPEEAALTVCSGLAPLVPRCDTQFTAYQSISISTGGAYNGQLTCRLNGQLYSYRIYVLEVVGGLLVTASATGPGLYAGPIHVHCESKGNFGLGGSLGGHGLFEVRFNYQ